MQEKQGGNETQRFDDEIVATHDKFLENKCITSIENRNFSIKFFLS